uniref:Calcium voltage-gated channel auxiliary subunit gamma 5 n=1 Tax=Pipistrellus kuhlii TaxID=59472 RepID=A0A7J7U7Q1_PIPKU|nr:calcium voltage-gated channel auxiliary subunit gamma 5 [Pipistrellus kuhlii]
MSACGRKALTLLSSVFAVCGLGLLGIAVSTDYWLYLEEGVVLPQNQSTEVRMSLHSGLWRVCFLAGEERGRCFTIEYVMPMNSQLTSESTVNVLKMIRSATPFPLVSLFFMFIGFILSNIGHIRPHRTILAFVSGIFFILSASALSPRGPGSGPEPLRTPRPFSERRPPCPRPLAGGGPGAVHLQHQRRDAQPDQGPGHLLQLQVRLVLRLRRHLLPLNGERGGDVRVPVHEEVHRRGHVPAPPRLLPPAPEQLLRLLGPVSAPRRLGPRPQPLRPLQRRLAAHEQQLPGLAQVPRLRPDVVLPLLSHTASSPTSAPAPCPDPGWPDSLPLAGSPAGLCALDPARGGQAEAASMLSCCHVALLSPCSPQNVSNCPAVVSGVWGQRTAGWPRAWG